MPVARNTELDYVRGEYIAFVDSDDVALPDFMMTVYNLAEKYCSDKEIGMKSEQMFLQWYGRYKK